MNADTDFCYLTTTGRVTGKPHEIEIWFATEDGKTLYILSGGGENSDWVRNLQAKPAVQLRVGDKTWAATAALVHDPEERSKAAALVYEKYQPRYNGDLSPWRDTALPVSFRIVENIHT